MTATPLPGLEVPEPPRAQIEIDVDRTLEELDRLELIGPKHAAAVGLCRLAARKLARVAEHGQAYGVAMLMRELREALAALPDIAEEEGERDEWNRLVDALRGSEVGDTTGSHPPD
jgi:hypothetical protein